MKRRHRFRCDHAGCAQAIHVDARALFEAHELAVDRGWEFYWGGPGHGWLARCPRHQKSRWFFMEQATELAA